MIKVTVDLGNSSISFRIEQRLPCTLPYATKSACLSLIPPDSSILLVSVNPLQEQWFLQHFPQAQKVGTDLLPYPLKTGVYPGVGADRILATYGAYLQKQSAAIVVDCGTAITIDAVSQTQEFLGGIIFPGPRLLSQSLHDYCALLPHIPSVLPSSHFLGKDTEDAIQTGISQGLRGLVERMITGIRQELQDPYLPVYLTGGASPAFFAELPYPCIPDLIHQALFSLFEK
jgi:pantothenate kinase type III